MNRNFFNRQTLEVAQNLLGKFLVRRIGKKEIILMITEVEAYDGFSDKASHASKGKTDRNKIMFGKAGNWYVYFTYGMHWMLNIVTGPENYPAAVLIRGGVEANGRRNVIARSEATKQSLRIIDGPAKLTKYLKINKKFNGKPADKKTGLWIEDRGIKIGKSQIAKSKRIGVDYAGPYWSCRKRRFYL